METMEDERLTEGVSKNAARNMIRAVVDAEEGLERGIAKDLGDEIYSGDKAVVEWLERSMKRQISDIQKAIETGKNKVEGAEAEIKMERATGGYAYADMGWALGNVRTEKDEIRITVSITTETGSYPIRDVAYAKTIDGGITWNVTVTDWRD